MHRLFSCLSLSLSVCLSLSSSSPHVSALPNNHKPLFHTNDNRYSIATDKSRRRVEGNKHNQGAGNKIMLFPLPMGLSSVSSIHHNLHVTVTVLRVSVMKEETVITSLLLFMLGNCALTWNFKHRPAAQKAQILHKKLSAL
jgi:hypothetical protein